MTIRLLGLYVQIRRRRRAFHVAIPAYFDVRAIREAAARLAQERRDSDETDT